jgi:aerobic-type carbon monoxide dehydrogenase small subunit (CoxS/CutS family)
MDQTIEFTVNGQARTVTTDPQRTLLEVLREDLKMTGTKYGCGEGQCRACTVLLDGRPIYSCLTPVSRIAGSQISTIEGLVKDEKLHPLQEAFLVEGFQCGYCASGMIVMASALLAENPKPTDQEIGEWMSGNICRCGNYMNALRAIRRASGQAVEEVKV